MTTFKLISWNINSVRLRIESVEKLLVEQDPDVLCLQETKCPDDKFPESKFRKLGYEHIAKKGQKGYHGVATIARRPFKHSFSREFCEMGDARHVAIDMDFPKSKVGGVRIHNFYVPAGGDEPDREKNVKFDHKMKFLNEMNDWIGGEESQRPAMLVGDLNIAPYETDVWDHKKLLKVVSHTPVETEALEAIRAKGNWIDTTRFLRPEPEPVFSWWSYRSPDWSKANKGRRLDHIWATEHLDGTIAKTKILKEARGWERPSDHAPVITEFEI